MSYALIDSGDGYKLEQFGDYLLARPSAQAVWKPLLPQKTWTEADAVFSREPSNRWTFDEPLPSSWVVEWGGIRFKITPTDFGHVGLFPEHALLWSWMATKIVKGAKVLNLFAYSGGATLAAAKAGASVCHLDASKAVVAWARENAQLNHLTEAPIRWIVEDVLKFLQREERRGVRYDGIILDPPTFGRGAGGEVFKIEKDLMPMLEQCVRLLSATPQFLILSCHTPGYTPIVLGHLLKQTLEGKRGKIEEGEMVIPGPLSLPSGAFARWSP
jgi:23S rRNA (cytosine1962-C5)-methyltransferase